MRTPFLLSLLVGLLSLPALAQDTPAPPAAVQAFAPTEATLVGTWNADFARMLADDPTLADEERAMMQSIMGQMSMSMTFGADGALRLEANMMGETESEVGTYQVTRVDGRVLIVSATSAGSDAPELMYITFPDDGESMRLSPDATQADAVWFQRAR